MKGILKAQINSNEHPFTKRLDGAFTDAIKGLNETLDQQTTTIVEDNLTRFSELVQTMNALLGDIHKDIRISLLTNNMDALNNYMGLMDGVTRLSQQVQENHVTLASQITLERCALEIKLIQFLSGLEARIMVKMEEKRISSLKMFELMEYGVSAARREIIALLADMNVPRNSYKKLPRWQQFKQWATRW
jgi:hypothetical protein